MNQTITTEELLALTKSADLLRQTAEQALRCDSLARELRSARNDRDHLAGILEKIMQIFEGHPDLGPQDFSELPLEVLALHDMYNEELVRNRELVRENETLARNMPSEPPADFAAPGCRMEFPPEFLFDGPCGAAAPTTKVIGQAWCWCERESDVPKDTIGLRFTLGGWICLCEIRQNTTTGALTYHPVGVKDLPLVQ